MLTANNRHVSLSIRPDEDIGIVYIVCEAGGVSFDQIYYTNNGDNYDTRFGHFVSWNTWNHLKLVYQDGGEDTRR